MVTARSQNIHTLASFGHQSNSGSPFPGEVIDFTNIIDGPHPTGSHNSDELTAMNEYVNIVCWEWFQMARSQNI